MSVFLLRWGQLGAENQRDREIDKQTDCGDGRGNGAGGQQPVRDPFLMFGAGEAEPFPEACRPLLVVFRGSEQLLATHVRASSRFVRRARRAGSRSAAMVPPRGLAGSERGSLTPSRICPSPMLGQLILSACPQHAPDGNVIGCSHHVEVDGSEGYTRSDLDSEDVVSVKLHGTFAVEALLVY